MLFLIVGLALLGLALVIIGRAVVAPRLRAAHSVAGIEQYGFSATLRIDEPRAARSSTISPRSSETSSAAGSASSTRPSCASTSCRPACTASRPACCSATRCSRARVPCHWL